MRSKPVQWLLAAALISTFAIPGWAQPELVGGEFKVNQKAEYRPVKPQVAFSPSGSSRIVWENEITGLLTRTFDRNGKPTTAETVLIASNYLPGIPASGNITVRRDPALAYLPGGEFLVFWTEEKAFLSLDYFYERREILEQDIYGQRFSAQGTPAGERFRVNGATANFQRRPRVAVHPDGIVVVWEQANGQVLDSTAVYGRLLTRRGTPAGNDFRVDAGDAREVWHLAVAANAPGGFAVTWEADKSDDPDVKVRFFDRRGEALTAAMVANPTTSGRQRRPDVLATRDGDFLVVWQSSLRSENVRSIMGQLYSPVGARIGKEIEMTRGKAANHVHAAPALALLPSGNIVVAWIDWAGILPDGIFAKLLDRDGAPIGADLLISQGRAYPQYLISVAANAHGDVIATWEALIQKEQAVAGRRLKAD